MKFIVILFLLFTSIYTLAQQSDSQLAYTYYQAKEYDKAAEKFLKLYERTHSANFLDYYIICLINGKEYDKAEDTLKKLLKTDDSNKDFLIDLGYIYNKGKPINRRNVTGKQSKKLFRKIQQSLIWPINLKISGNIAGRSRLISKAGYF